MSTQAHDIKELMHQISTMVWTHTPRQVTWSKEMNAHRLVLTRRAISLVIGLLAIASFPGNKAEAASSKGAVWIIDDMVRLGPNAQPGTATSITVEAGRGEYVALQPVVRATGSDLTNVRVTASALVGPGTISADNIEVYRESFINVPNSTPHDWGSTPLPPGTYPDGLIPTKNPADGKPITTGATLKAQNYTIGTGKTQPYWVDIFVPRTAAPGNYAGNITLQADQGSATLKIALRVWKFTLPVTPSLKSSFQMWVNSHGKQDYLELMKHRIMPVAPGSYDQDLKALGMSLVELGFFAQGGQSHCSMSSPPSQSSLQSAKSSHAGGLTLYNLTADEIGDCNNLVNAVRDWGNALHGVGAKQLITMPPRSDLYGSVDWWAMLPRQFTDSPPDLGAVRANGGEVWSYTALNQDDYSPKWQIDFSPMNHRIYGFLNQSVGATGLLYWAVDSWSSDPWTNPYTWEGTYPGDGFLVYPGANVGLSTIVPSMRLKYLRAAVQDYEYVELLSKAGQRSWALQTIKPIAQDWRSWSDDPNQLRNVRHQLAVKLDSLTP